MSDRGQRCHQAEKRDCALFPGPAYPYVLVCAAGWGLGLTVNAKVVGDEAESPPAPQPREAVAVLQEEPEDSKPPGWPESTGAAGLLGLFLTVLAILPLRQGGVSTVAGISGAAGRTNPMERSPSPTRKTVPVLTRQGDAMAKTKRDDRVARGRAESRMERDVRHRLGGQDEGVRTQPEPAGDRQGLSLLTLF